MLFKELKRICADNISIIDINNRIVIDHNEYDNYEIEEIMAIEMNILGVKIKNV